MTTKPLPPDPLRHSRGLVRIEMMAESLGVPWQAIEAFVALFSRELQGHMALSVDLHTGRMGVMTRCQGAEAHLRAARLMGEQSVAEESIRHLLVRAKHFQYQDLLFCSVFGADGIVGFSYDFEHPSEVVLAHAWLADSGVGADGIGLMEAMAEVLAARVVHRIGALEHVDGTRGDRVCFSLPAVSESWDRIQAAVRLVGLEDRDFAPVVAHRAALADSPTFVSLDFLNRRVRRGLSLGVQEVHPMVVETVLDGTCAGDEAADRARLPMELSGHQQHSCVSFCLTPGQTCRVKTAAITAC